MSLDCYKYYENIQRYILSQTDAAYAEDLTQDVFEEFIRRNPDPSGIKNPEAYLIGIARNHVAQHLRNKRSAGQMIPIEAIKDRPHPQQCELDVRLLGEIETALATLPPKASEAIRLRLIEGLDSRKAAQVAGYSVEILYRRFYEGLKVIRKKMGIWGSRVLLEGQAWFIVHKSFTVMGL